MMQVSRLTGVIQRVCDSSGCGLVIDIGSGLVSTDTIAASYTMVMVHAHAGVPGPRCDSTLC